jgi:hypothetical protein
MSFRMPNLIDLQINSYNEFLGIINGSFDFSIQVYIKYLNQFSDL